MPKAGWAAFHGLVSSSQHPWREVLLWSLHHRCGNWDTERLSDLVTQATICHTWASNLDSLTMESTSLTTTLGCLVYVMDAQHQYMVYYILGHANLLAAFYFSIWLHHISFNCVDRQSWWFLVLCNYGQPCSEQYLLSTASWLWYSPVRSLFPSSLLSLY